MSKKSSFGVGTVLAAAAGVVAGAVGVFLSDKDNRKAVVREAKKVERVIEKDIKKAATKVKKTGAKAKKAVKKVTKRRT